MEMFFFRGLVPGFIEIIEQLLPESQGRVFNSRPYLKETSMVFRNPYI